MGSLSQDVLTLISLGGLRAGCPTPGWTTSRQAEGDKDLVLASTNQKGPADVSQASSPPGPPRGHLQGLQSDEVWASLAASP